MNRIYLVAAFLLLGAVSGFARKKHDAPGTGNPVIPGYFADPTIKKFGDTYYMYATTDGSGAGFGPAQVWTSKDFVNWTLMPMNYKPQKKKSHFGKKEIPQKRDKLSFILTFQSAFKFL